MASSASSQGHGLSGFLQVGQTVRAAKAVATIKQFLGGGSQGEVYRISLNENQAALKWYFATQATHEQRAALETLIQMGPPTANFLWPMAIATLDNSASVSDATAGVGTATANGSNGFGYVMPLRDPSYKGLLDLVAGRIDPDFRALATAGYELANSFLQLHAKGLCYRDISFGNVFLDPNNGNVLICDNDNVAVDGSAVCGVLGTPDFMAPEIVRGQAKPSRQTDIYSLAVLLFYIFHIHHPLFGKKVMAMRCLDLPARNKLCGTEPVFIFDPVDKTNQALPLSVDPMGEAGDNAIRYWRIYPKFLQDLFTKSFTEGLRDPQHGRVQESEWRAAMIRLRDSIHYCGKCSKENFYDADAPKNPDSKAALCMGCNSELKLPPRLHIGKHVVMLNFNTQLYPHHVDDERLWDFSLPVAMVNQHPTTQAWGLKNLTSEKWNFSVAGGPLKDVDPGRSVPLSNGTTIHFGKLQGEIRW